MAFDERVASELLRYAEERKELEDAYRPLLVLRAGEMFGCAPDRHAGTARRRAGVDCRRFLGGTLTQSGVEHDRAVSLRGGRDRDGRADGLRQRGAQFLNNMQPMAVQNAEARGRFELNCPTAEATVLSREVVQPVPQGPFIGAGLQRAEYTVGVSGCGARKTFVAICPDGGDGCLAAGPRALLPGVS